VQSRSWKSVPVRYWRKSGFEELTSTDDVADRIPRPSEGATEWLEPDEDDWNGLW